ncbi:SRPBCC family protein [Deinococcus taeanensis]|uniref:SRPBCC family protein n=1 Tax=Deinococcus taeanensis TaxID=2737050 RepID=UPI001CDC5587|nr:SRPBCC family protein [Deinococcus taeanensis]UBV41497.1 SRPBCC family protein [Deinococcus taeanensis]
MWNEQFTATSTAAPERLYALWADVTTWPAWNADVTRAELHGPFATNSVIHMTTGDGTLELRLADVRANEQFTDEVLMDGLTIRTTHQLQRLPGGHTQVTYALQITGENAAQVGPELGPAITHDFPQTIAALIRHAEQ